MPALAFAPDNRIGFEPNQQAFIVEVGAAPPRSPSLPTRPVENLRGHSCVLQRPPGAPGPVVQVGSRPGKLFALRMRRAQAAAGSEHVTQILRQPFIDPEQIAAHGLLIIGCSQAGRAAILSVPGMDKLVRKESREKSVAIRVEQRAFGRAVVARLVVLQAERLRSEEHTSELQSQSNLVCRLLLEKKKNKNAECLVCNRHVE